jgi:transposase
MNIKYKIIYVDEFNTTQCCYKCENKMKDHFENNKTVRGLKDCHHCSKNAIKTRNRDLNASINIFKIAECFIKGNKRPKYLQRKKCS